MRLISYLILLILTDNPFHLLLGISNASLPSRKNEINNLIMEVLELGHGREEVKGLPLSPRPITYFSPCLLFK